MDIQLIKLLLYCGEYIVILFNIIILLKYYCIFIVSTLVSNMLHKRAREK